MQLAQTISLRRGAAVRCGSREFEIVTAIDLDQVLGKDRISGERQRLFIKDLAPIVAPTETSNEQTDLTGISEADWTQAKRRFDVIEPLLNSERRTKADVRERGRLIGVSANTVYRWLQLYDGSERLTSLLPTKPNGGRGKTRLSSDSEAVMIATIDDFYLDKQKRSATETCAEVTRRCKVAQVPSPHPNTVRNRIALISDRERLSARSEKKAAVDRFTPRPGRFDTDTPLGVVQIDHAKLDVVLVDEITRRPIGRPWLTIGIDVFSRMVTGYYISLDNPSFATTGLCIAHSILPKEAYLTSLGVDGRWPVWGFPREIHTDNAKEFRGVMLRRPCEEYGITMSFRPVKVPNYGGHIERLIGNLARKIKGLPGSTFSNPKERAEYDSDAASALTLRDLEKWLASYITGPYHEGFHSGISMSPLQKFQEGLLGDGNSRGRGLPDRLGMSGAEKLRLDFMPSFERKIESYGVQIDKVHYYSAALRTYYADSRGGRKAHLFRRDPRDISRIYFFDEVEKRYLEIPYRDIGRPPISLWEMREVTRQLKSENRENIDERAIFEKYEDMRRIVELARVETKAVRRKREQKRVNAKVPRAKLPPEEYAAGVDEISTVTPFDELEEL